MRIGFLSADDVSACTYRSRGLADVLGRQGHDVELVVEKGKSIDVARLARCEVVLVYRRSSPIVQKCVDELQRRGVAIVWDNDDDPRLIPREVQHIAGLDRGGAERDFRAQAKMIQRADLVTTPSEVLAERYREAGAARTCVIENYLHPDQRAAPSEQRNGIVIGWVGGLEHRADAQALGITESLRRVMERHPEVSVETIGVQLDLGPERYRHQLFVPMPELKFRIREFDIAIAPLADHPMSYARSNVKVKEYAAAGAPWLASARGPYLGFGPKQGGWLVEDDGWEDALERLVTSGFKRSRLRRRAVKWGKEQTMDRHTDHWIAAFEHALEAAATRRDAATAAAARTA